MQMTQAEFARAVGVHSDTVSRWETADPGLVPARLSEMAMLAEASRRGVALGLLDALTVLSMMSDRADGETDAHCRRVSRLCEVIARRMREDVFSAAVAGQFHDAGKIVLSPSLLHFPGRLQPSERASLQEHAAAAVPLLRLVAGDVVAEAVHCHHEELSGTGYPRGLSGKQIGFLGRLLAVADQLDARTSPRAYRKKHATVAEVIKKMLTKEASMYDAEIVRVAAAVLKDERRRKRTPWAAILHPKAVAA